MGIFVAFWGPMEQDISPPNGPDETGGRFDFTPVPLQRRRYDGWSPLVQKRFIHALSVMGSVGAACRAVGRGRVSAYRLREREGAESFADAWDAALEAGQDRQYNYLLDRAVNGVTTVRVLRGGSVSVEGGPDMALLRGALGR